MLELENVENVKSFSKMHLIFLQTHSPSPLICTDVPEDLRSLPVDQIAIHPPFCRPNLPISPPIPLIFVPLSGSNSSLCFPIPWQRPEWRLNAPLWAFQHSMLTPTPPPTFNCSQPPIIFHLAPACAGETVAMVGRLRACEMRLTTLSTVAVGDNDGVIPVSCLPVLCVVAVLPSNEEWHCFLKLLLLLLKVPNVKVDEEMPSWSH